MAVDPTVDDVLAVIELALNDGSVPDHVREKIGALRSTADDAPKLTHERLCRIGEPAARAIMLAPPTTTLYRAVSLPVFRRKCARPEFSALTDLLFLNEVRRAASPDDFLTDALDRTRVVFDAPHSWLVDGPTIESRSGSELPALLELRGKEPPFALCRLTVPLMHAANVLVRRPNGLDAAIGLQPQWHPNGIPAGTEYVDSDISGAAIDRVLWRP